MTLRTAIKASQAEGSSGPQYTGHEIQEDFGESELSADMVAPAKKPRSSNSRPMSRTKQAVAHGSQAEQSTSDGSRKRKASSQSDQGEMNSRVKKVQTHKPKVPPARAKGTSCGACKKRKMRCTHSVLAQAEFMTGQEAEVSADVASQVAGPNLAAPARSRKPASRRGKRVVAGQEELPHADAEVAQASTLTDSGVPAEPVITPSSSPASVQASTPSTDDPRTYTTPPSSVSANGDTTDDRPAEASPDKQEASRAITHARSSSTASSVLSSVPSNIGEVTTSKGTTQTATTSASGGEATSLAEQSAVAELGSDDEQETPSLTAKEKRFLIVKKAWVKRKENAAKAIAAQDRNAASPSRAQTTTSTPVEQKILRRRAHDVNAAKTAKTGETAAGQDEPDDEGEALTTNEDGSAAANKGNSERRKNATAAAGDATVEDEDNAEHTPLTAKEKRSASVKKGWERRRQNAAADAQAAKPAASQEEDKHEDETLTAQEKRSAAAVKGHLKRKQNATEVAEAAKAAPSKALKRETSVRRAKPGKQTKVVTLPLSKIASASTSKPRLNRKNQSPHTPQPKVDQQKSGLLTPTSSQPERSSPELALDIDPAVRQLAEKLTRREPLADKPLPQGQPLVWADSRQALCETVPYFKMPQSGCHQNDRHVYAFLFDSIGHCREYMDSDVIIARAGGGMEYDTNGQMVQKKDHLMSECQVQAVLNDIALQNPLVLICGDRNVGAVCKMPHKYNVLGWYKPVSVWAEKTLGKSGKTWTTIKYRFERLNDSTPAWHQPAEQLVTDEDRQVAGDLTSTERPCTHCDQSFAQVYLCGWMCLNPDCDQFWKLESGQDAPYGKLLYNPAFLLNRTRWAKEEEPYSVRPAVPSVGNTVGDNLTYINTRGICCPQCGRCSSRRLFKGWRCDNPSCTFENFPQHIPVTPPMLHNPWENSGDGPALARNKHEATQGVQVKVAHVHGFKVYTYSFEGVNGRFVHAVSNAKINREPRGPDEMFAAIQRQDEPGMDMHLERRRFGIEKMPVNKVDVSAEGPVLTVPVTPLQQNTSPVDPHSSLLTPPGPAQSSVTSELPTSQSGGDTFLSGIEEAAEAGDSQPGQSQDAAAAVKPAVEDGDLMTAFSINYGMPYKFIAVGGSLPFTDSPWPVRTCRADLNWASQTFLDPSEHMDFNEELIFAYLEGQKIEYHDDGESGLGPRIATLSLGGKAKMHLRMKMKHYTGCSKQGILTADKPMPHSIDGPEMYQKRLAAWDELQTLKTTDKPTYERRRKEIPKELGLYAKRMKKAEDLVTVTLNHGDIVLMEGYEIQQYLEHKVVPEQCLRFALTCRTVLPDHLKPEERPAYEVDPDDESESCLRDMVARKTRA